MLPLFQATRYHLPLPPGRLTPRPRLFARLDAAVAGDGGLALVAAPPGLGKSTLVSAWLAARGAPWVWLSLDAGDNEPRQLLRHLVIALEAVAPAAGARLLPRLAAAPAAEGGAEDAATLAGLLELLAGLPGPVVLALDDTHVLAHRRARALLAGLAAGAPPTLRMVLIAAAEPPDALAARGGAGAAALGEADLRFSAEEAADLLDGGAGLRLAPAEAAALARRAGGSPAALLRCALALQGHPQPGRLVAALAADGRAHLDGLLQRLLAADMGEGAVDAFHRRASLWYEDAGLVEQAVRHALASRDPAFAAGLLERQGVALLERGEQWALGAWCRALPEGLFAERPRLCLLHAWCLALAPGGAGRQLLERRLAQAERRLPEADEATRSWLAGHRANLRGHMLLYAPEPDFEALIAYSRQAMATLPEDDAAVRSASAMRIAYGYMGLGDAEGALHALDLAQRLALKGRNYSGAIACVFDRARIAHQRGRLREAAQQCRLWKEAFPRLAQDAGPIFPASGCLDLALGCVLLEQGDLAGAAACLGRGLELTGGIVQFAVVGYPALARLHAAQGDPAAAAAALARLQALWPDTAPYVGGLLALLALRAAPDDQAARAAAAAWAAANAPPLSPSTLPPGIGKTIADEPRYGAALAWARIQTLLGRPREALACLEPLAIGSLKRGLAHRVIELSLAQALALAALGARRRALAALDRALARAEPEGYSLVFAEEPGLAGLLAERRAARAAAPARPPRPPAPPRHGGAAPPAPAAAPPQARLSAREVEVLRLLAGSASNEQIAARLVLSANTVKTHLRHIYEKLGVRSRREALARGYALGLLP